MASQQLGGDPREPSFANREARQQRPHGQLREPGRADGVQRPHSRLPGVADVILERTGLTELRGPIVARMREDTAEFVARAARGLARNPILVALAAELAELPEALVQPRTAARGRLSARGARGGVLVGE